MNDKHEFAAYADPKRNNCVKCGEPEAAAVHQDVPKRAPYTPPVRVETVYSNHGYWRNQSA